MTISKQCEGKCPYCGSEHLKPIDQDEFNIGFICMKCQRVFCEVHERRYIETQYTPEREDEQQTVK